ncbi:hypothetical protein [Mesorhizobium sp. B2-4-10]|uniref:hypothetical protein n=1 Tax=Mesorhizobium sp. B2-4-10 TaxID=2589939 RepID=UPI0015E3EAD4|nr:hypothetical protein [Mesorhizobium sp. B2-4-10]
MNRFDAKTEADRSCATKPDNLISYRQVCRHFRAEKRTVGQLLARGFDLSQPVAQEF